MDIFWCQEAAAVQANEQNEQLHFGLKVIQKRGGENVLDALIQPIQVPKRGGENVLDALIQPIQVPKRVGVKMC